MKTITNKQIKWIKGNDFMDGSPRYTFEGRDPAYTISNIEVVITAERRRKYQHDSQSARIVYTGHVRHNPSETGDTTDEFESVKKCKIETEKLFNEYCSAFPNDIDAY